MNGKKVFHIHPNRGTKNLERKNKGTYGEEFLKSRRKQRRKIILNYNVNKSKTYLL